MSDVADHVEGLELNRAAAGRRPARTRRRLSRTLSRARWSEYRALLHDVQAAGYAIVSLEAWLLEPARWAGRNVWLLRHDVDQHPRSALVLADIERELGVTSTWYFRWRTAHGELIAELRRRGHAVGLHYETLSRQALARGELPEREIARLKDGARHVLRGEIDAFATRYGPIRSVCPHGDSRAPHARNSDLLLNEDWTSYGVDLDAHLAMRRHGLGMWLTDRSRAEGGWKEGLEPRQILLTGTTPVLCLVHPNNWVSGLGLWRDRGLSRVLPDAGHDPRRPARPMRSGSDVPPI